MSPEVLTGLQVNLAFMLWPTPDFVRKFNIGLRKSSVTPNLQEIRRDFQYYFQNQLKILNLSMNHKHREFVSSVWKEKKFVITRKVFLRCYLTTLSENEKHLGDKIYWLFFMPSHVMKENKYSCSYRLHDY